MSQIRLLSARLANQIAAGEVHTVALTHSGKVLVWGGNTHRQLDLGDDLLYPTPSAMPLQLQPGESAVHVAAGGYRTAVLTSRGRLLLFGVLTSDVLEEEWMTEQQGEQDEWGDDDDPMDEGPWPERSSPRRTWQTFENIEAADG